GVSLLLSWRRPALGVRLPLMPAHRRPQNGRDAQGRFARGCPGGPGNPRVRRLAEAQAAIADAIEPRVIGAVMKRLAKSALEGDITAAKVLLDRVLGRPGTEFVASDFELPAVESADDVAKAFQSLLQHAAAGRVSAEDAARYAGVLELSRRAIETAELDARLKRIEEQQGLPPLRLASA